MRPRFLNGRALGDSYLRNTAAILRRWAAAKRAPVQAPLLHVSHQHYFRTLPRRQSESSLKIGLRRRQNRTLIHVTRHLQVCLESALHTIGEAFKKYGNKQALERFVGNDEGR